MTVSVKQRLVIRAYPFPSALSHDGTHNRTRIPLHIFIASHQFSFYLGSLLIAREQGGSAFIHDFYFISQNGITFNGDARLNPSPRPF